MRPAFSTAIRFSLLFTLVALTSVAAAAERRVPLLNVSKRQLPNDTASENQTKLTIEDAPTALGGKALKVVYADGDSFGMARGASQRNWKPFAAIEFSAFNPSRQRVGLTFAVRHQGTTGFQTRVDLPVTLQPGKNEVRLSMDKMANADGSKPDLSDVVHRYLARPAKRRRCTAATSGSSVATQRGPKDGFPIRRMPRAIPRDWLASVRRRCPNSLNR